jgi:inhibitor of cysteine peptidase
MSFSFRVLASVGIVILAAAGCQKGERAGSTTTDAPSKVEGGAAGSKGAQAPAKAGGAATSRAGTAAAARGAGSGASVSLLTLADDGRAIDLKLGQVLTVVLDSNRANGFSWALVGPVETVIVPDGTPLYVPKSGRGGSGGTETWRFRAARRGQQTVRMEYRRHWVQNVPERTFRFTATVR